MIPGRIKGFTNELAPPPDWDVKRDGACVTLPIKAEIEKKYNLKKARYDLVSVKLHSAWQPTPAELELLNKGGSVILTVFSGNHPPVMLTVSEAADEAEIIANEPPAQKTNEPPRSDTKT